MSGARWWLACGALLLGLSGPAAAAVYEVDVAAACPGDGSALAPFCSIGLAAAVAAPGDVVNVAPGVYREQVTPPASGAAGLPITYRGARGARIVGTDDLSGAAGWALASGTTWVTAFDPDTNPAQVFVDREALAAWAGDASSVPAGAFLYDAGGKQLYVNLGGDNPGKHDVEAGARAFGFAFEGRSHLVVEGFSVRGHNTNGIRVRASTEVAIRNNRVSHAASFGLVADGGTGPIEIAGNVLRRNGDAGLRLRTNVTQATVARNRSHHNASHGILATDTTASVFSGNVLHANARPGGASTTGLMLAAGADGNRVERSLAYENQDTGIQVSDGADANLLVRNVSFANGDHGFDVRECDGTRLVSNTAWANVNDGFSIEGNVTNAYLRNNIGSDNGLFTNGNDLWVDATSTVGFSADHDVFHRSSSSGNTIDYARAEYTSAADFAAATGHEQHGSSANPNLADPANGDFHPGLGPALDSADAGASGFEALDLDGLPPIDLAGVPNTGAGVPDFADRGALERTDAAPVAKLRVAPRKGAPGVVVTADASGSSDDVGIVSYRFAWGDGTPDTVQSGPLATHTFAESGHYRVKLAVTDTAGQTGVHQQPVLVKAPKPKPPKGKPEKPDKAEKPQKPEKPGKGKAKGHAKQRHARAR